MSTVLRFRASTRSYPQRPPSAGRTCEIVIFPGVRIERRDPTTDLDLGHRLHGLADGDFDRPGNTPQPRRTH